MPTFVDERESSWSNSASQTSGTLTVEAGDVLICFAGVASSGVTFATPTTSGAPLAWTLKESITISSYPAHHAWYATVDAARTLTVSLARTSGSESWGIAVHQWRGGVVGASAKGSAASGAPSLSLTTTAASSGISYIGGDWIPATGTATWRTINGSAGVQDTNVTIGSKIYGAHWGNVGAAGAKTTGMSAPSGQKWAAIAIEIKDNPLVTVTRDWVMSWPILTPVTRDWVMSWPVHNYTPVTRDWVTSWPVIGPPPTPVPQALAAWPTGSRTEAFSYRTYGLDFTPLGDLAGVKGCDLDGSIWTAIRLSGSLEWSGQEPPAWGQILIQPWYHVEDVGEWPLGMFYAAAPATEHDSAPPKSVRVQLYDVTYPLLNWRKLPAPFSLPPGTVVTAAITAQLQAAGIPRFSVTPSSATLTAPMAWDPGDSRGKVINDLAASISYWAAHADAWGTVHVDPYTPPLERSPAYHFARGENGIHVPKWAETCDDFNVPNRMSGVQKVADGQIPAVYTALLDDLDPKSPYTVAARGFAVDGETLREVDAATPATLKAVVDRALLDAASKVRNLSVTHLWLPTVGLGDAVTFAPDGRVRRASVSKQSVSLQQSPFLVRSEWREVG